MRKKVDYFRSLNALLGTYGVKTSRLMSNQDYFVCADALWPGITIRATTLAELQAAIKRMSMRERRGLAKANIHRIPNLFLSHADKHERALSRALEKERAA